MVDGIHRGSYSEAQADHKVPDIPVQVISYGDAVHFMSQLSDHTPPSDWVGGLQVEYRIAQSEENDK
jgi:N-acetylated-alpha-linked acidic dipeptidase